jgi:hypothetical protein
MVNEGLTQPIEAGDEEAVESALARIVVREE